TGDQVTRKMEMQNTADAVAVSSANWVARGMNVVSMNNVAMTQVLAVIVIAKSLVQTAEIALPIAEAELKAAIAMEASAFPPVQAAGVLLELGATAAIEVLTPIQTVGAPFLNAITEPNTGSLWMIMRALEAMSTAVVKL